MKISESQLKNIINEEIKKAISEAKYKKISEIVKKCVNETINEWNDPDFDYDEKYKEMGNIDSWDEFEQSRDDFNKKYGRNAEDIFNGKYEEGDYFQDSDYRFRQDYWDENNNDVNKLGLTDIQQDNIEQGYKNRFESIVKQCVNKAISEAINNQNYTHFAILKQNGKIVNGWDYSDYDPADLRSDKKYYFTQDIIDYGFNPKDIKILTKKACIKQGINPDDDSCWTNGIEFKNESINKNINEMYEEDYQFDETFDDEEETYSEGAIDFYDFANICNQNGWDYHDYMEVSNGEQSGYRYVFRGNGNCSFEDLITQLKQAANNPDGIIPGTASNKNAPEQKYYTIVVLD